MSTTFPPGMEGAEVCDAWEVHLQSMLSPPRSSETVLPYDRLASNTLRINVAILSGLLVSLAAGASLSACSSEPKKPEADAGIFVPDAAMPSNDAAAPDAAVGVGAQDASVQGVEGGPREGGAPPTGDGGVMDPQDAGTAAAGDWPSFGGDLSHSRSNPLEMRIATTTVNQLRPAWNKLAPGVSATPAIVDGVVYWTDWAGGAHASRASDGSSVWDKSFPHGFTSSPCVDGDRLYLTDRNVSVYALARDTGEKIWETRVDTLPLTHLWSSPVVSDGVLVVGVAYDGTQAERTPLPTEQVVVFRGAVVGLDANDGHVLWRFEVTREPGPNGTEYAPGVSVWGSASIDAQRGIAYIGTGNAYAQPAGPYSDCLLALDLKTGALKWSRQFTADDGFTAGNILGGPDYDIGATPNLFTIESGGTRVDVVGVGDKSGFYRVLTRDKGEPVWQTELEPGLLLSLRKTGGIIAPAAYAEGRIFVASNTSWATSKVWALDATTGAIQWTSDEIDSVNFGGPAVANGVVFFGGSGFRVTEQNPNGKGVGDPSTLLAFDAVTGAVLHRTQLHAGRSGGYAIADGRVYVGTGFTFYAYSDEPLNGALEVFDLP